ncbi:MULTISPECIES: hypothetical protein [Mycolicibacter]|uniref:Uncharacterized protein n=1 Tax=Mycolicibacter longobardus TaxID=1108812 RepID=A0A1X1YBW1_9MYCO|nr:MULTISPECIES: hypothetical protein [Mycolicibacter]ORW08480.1 hypothetical protein AWC16_18950 [Mycolicibacter longobardus]RAV04411.1 hypothetical protein DQP56_00920 [Mycolicibacter senuensis]
MADIDFGLAYDFIDPADGIPRQLRFERNWSAPGAHQPFDGTGQLVAVVASAGRVDNGSKLAISRPEVQFDAVEAALDGWQTWAMLGEDSVNLGEIRRRIDAAGLGVQ